MRVLLLVCLYTMPIDKKQEITDDWILCSLLRPWAVLGEYCTYASV